MPLAAGETALGLSGDLSGRVSRPPSLGRLIWLARDSSMLISVVMALPPLKSRLSWLHSLLSSHKDGRLAVCFSSRSLKSKVDSVSSEILGSRRQQEQQQSQRTQDDDA